MDPIAVLPEELFDLTLSQLPFKSLARCREVSKDWKRCVEGNPVLWRRHLNFSGASIGIEAGALAVYMNLCRVGPDDKNCRSINLIKALTVHNVCPDNSTLDYMALNGKYFETLDLICLQGQFERMMTMKPLINHMPKFPHLSSLTVQITGFNRMDLKQILRYVPSLKKLDYMLKAGYDGVFPVNKLQLRCLKGPYQLESFKFTLLTASSDPILHLGGFVPVLEACSYLVDLELNSFITIQPDYLHAREEFAQLLKNHMPSLESIHLKAEAVDSCQSISSRNLKHVVLEDLALYGLAPRTTPMIESLQVACLSLPRFTTLLDITQQNHRPPSPFVADESDNSIFSLCNILNTSQLKILEMNFSQVPELSTKDGFTNFMGPYISNLTVLSLYSNKYVNDSTIPGITKSCPKLRQLDIGFTLVSSHGVIDAINAGIKVLGIQGLELQVYSIAKIIELAFHSGVELRTELLMKKGRWTHEARTQVNTSKMKLKS